MILVSYRTQSDPPSPVLDFKLAKKSPPFFFYYSRALPSLTCRIELSELTNMLGIISAFLLR